MNIGSNLLKEDQNIAMSRIVLEYLRFSIVFLMCRLCSGVSVCMVFVNFGVFLYCLSRGVAEYQQGP